MNNLAPKKVSFLEYLKQEEQSEGKHEYHDGFVWAMAGDSPNHSTISGNIYTELASTLKKNKRKCRPFNGDLKIYIEAFNCGVYPDAMVVYGNLDYHSNRKDVISRHRFRRNYSDFFD